MEKPKVKGRKKVIIWFSIFIGIYVAEYFISLNGVGFEKSFDYINFPYVGTILLGLAYGIGFVAIVMHRAGKISIKIVELSYYWDYSVTPAVYIKRSGYVSGSNTKQEKSDKKEMSPLLSHEDQVTLDTLKIGLKKIKMNSRLLFFLFFILHSIATVYYYIDEPFYWWIPLACFVFMLIASELRFNYNMGHAKGSKDRTLDTKW